MTFKQIVFFLVTVAVRRKISLQKGRKGIEASAFGDCHKIGKGLYVVQLYLFVWLPLSPTGLITYGL